MKARVREARDRATRAKLPHGVTLSERVHPLVEIPELWALELSSAVRALLHELQHARVDGAPSLGQASATLRDALVLGLNELAREGSVAELDVRSEREPNGTHVSPVVPRRRSDIPPR